MLATINGKGKKMKKRKKQQPQIQNNLLGELLYLKLHHSTRKL
jgi:hypothetical protein